MNRTHFWKLVLILFVLCWALFELTPPVGRDLLAYFQQRAVARDATYSNIVQKAELLQKELPDREFGNLVEAVGTNDISKYFPHINAKGETAPSKFVLNRLQKEAAGQIRKGLDLQGGTSFLVEMDTTGLDTDTNRVNKAEGKVEALSHAVETLRKRVDKLGVAEPIIQMVGENRIEIQLPGLSEADKEEARTQIEKAAFLEFRMVHPSNAIFMAEGLIPPGYEVKRMSQKQEDGTKVLIPFLVSKKPTRGLTGKYLTRAFVSRAELTNEPEIVFELDPEGADLFGQITREFKPEETPQGRHYHQLAIILDGDLYSAPRIDEPIEGGRGRITGTFDFEEAQTLANVLENPLEAPVKIIRQNSVDASLGKDSIKSGIRATIIGTIAVSAFMLIYYMLAGLVANVALVLNVIILLGVLCSIDATLTMPGIAGIVLTIGMAVDANVLIYERIREELAAGKSMRGAIQAGYSKAFGTIMDANLTTLISAFILIYMGSGPVKGFGITLAIGLMTSVFTALTVTRLLFDFFLSKGWIKELKMMELIKVHNIDFLRFAKPAFTVSWLLILIGIGYGIYRGKEALGTDFVGGDNITFSFRQKVPVEQLRETVGKLGVGDASIGYQRDISTGRETLGIITRATTAPKAAGARPVETVVQEALQKEFAQAEFKMVNLDQVGPTVGAEILRTAIVAVILALFGILVYVAFRYELSFSVASVVAIIHDVLMTLGWFFLTGRQLSSGMVAAILTIIGFSINDTIVIFDRIREDLKLGVRGSFAEVINRALNETLSRTIITSGTALLAALALYIFGGPVINDFAFTFVVGILTGTYSTIYIASALVLWWHKGQRPKSTTQITVDSRAAAERV